MAAPSAVVSNTFGLSTLIPKILDRNCINQLFSAIPPSTFNRSGFIPSWDIALNKSLVWYATDSNAALTKCALLVSRVIPYIAPRASGSHHGAPSPVKAGTIYTP